MKFFFGLQCISGVENENDYSLNQYNYSEITQVLKKKDITKKIDKMNEDKNIV